MPSDKPEKIRLQNSRFPTFSEGAKRRKREPRVWSARAYSHYSLSPFLHSLQTFRSNMAVARVRKRYDCFAV